MSAPNLSSSNLPSPAALSSTNQARPQQALIFHAGALRFAVLTKQVLCVIKKPKLRPCAMAPAALVGLFAHDCDGQQRWLPVLDICLLTQDRACVDHIATRLIVLRIDQQPQAVAPEHMLKQPQAVAQDALKQPQAVAQDEHVLKQPQAVAQDEHVLKQRSDGTAHDQPATRYFGLLAERVLDLTKIKMEQQVACPNLASWLGLYRNASMQAPQLIHPELLLPAELSAAYQSAQIVGADGALA